MTPSQVGERADAAVMAALAAAGKHILLPFGQKRYDLAYEEDGKLIKVQVKSGRETAGAIFFRTHSAIRERSRDYSEDADVFGVYCHDRQLCTSFRSKKSRAARRCCVCLHLATVRSSESGGHLSTCFLRPPSSLTPGPPQ